MTNPLLAPTRLPHGLPPFRDIADDHWAPAFDHALTVHRDEIEAIAASPDPPTFANTVVALERAGLLLDRVRSLFLNQVAADTNDRVEAVKQRYAPKLAAHDAAILLDPRLFTRVSAVRDRLDGQRLDAESRYLVERHHTRMRLAGAGLNDDDRTTLRRLDARIAALATTFDSRLRADTNDLAVHVEDADRLAGLPPDRVSAAHAAARARGLGGYLLTLRLPTDQPALASLRDRSLRRQLWEASRARGSRGNANDTRDVVRELVRLRAERAHLLGFDSHAAAVAADRTAGTPAAIDALLGDLATAAARNARAEHEALRTLAAAQGDADVAAWDWPYWTDRRRRLELDIDTDALRAWFEAERVLRDGVFYAAGRLYGLTFTERTDLDGHHPGVRVFEVREGDGTDVGGAHVGLYLLDLYTRDSKRGGAWMSSLAHQSVLTGDVPVVVNNLNVPEPGHGESTLLTLDDVRTLFHEFGHALHGLLARVTYPSFAGTRVFRDFVEYPSQVNEMWMLWPEVLAKYAVHHETGEALPDDVAERLRAATTFNEGFATSEYLAAAVLDQAWHRLSPDDRVDDIAGFEARTLAAAGLDHPAVPPRYATPYFAHVFAGGYDAGYYSYIWSEVLDADTVEWFRDNGGLTRTNGERFRDLVLGIGGSRDPLVAYRDFRGRDAAIGPLLRRRGLQS